MTRAEQPGLFSHRDREIFDAIYGTDLVYVADCWTLCGDAHCCSFSRYKKRFKLITKNVYQELPLLPGEYEYLRHRGWLQQFGDFDHKVIEYGLDERSMRIETIVSRRPSCACDHDTRPTVCRLYPLLPVFDIEGRVTGIEPFGIYEELESIGEIERACRLQSLPFLELQKFLTVCNAIARSPCLLFYMMAYHFTKLHVASRVLEAKNGHNGDVFTLFEKLLIRDRLINHKALRAQLTCLAGSFRQRYDTRFDLG